MPDIDLSIDRPKMKSYFFSETEGGKQKTEKQKTEEPLRTVNCER